MAPPFTPGSGRECAQRQGRTAQPSRQTTRLRDLPQPYAGKVASPRLLTREITLLETVIANLLGGRDGYHAIQALPGIGPVLGAVIVAEIGDIRRFASTGRLCSWAGLTPRHRESDLKVARGHITKQVSPILRWAMIAPAKTARPRL